MSTINEVLAKILANQMQAEEKLIALESKQSVANQSSVVQSSSQ